MVTFIVRTSFAPEDRAEGAAVAALLAAESRKEPGCITYIPYEIEEDPSAILFYEQYTGPEAIEAHCASEHYKKYALSGVMTRAVSQKFEHLSPIV